MLTLGFDTSNYTTSVSAYDGDEFINIRRLLPVPNGARGLRQSDALFHHVKQLPILFSELCKRINTSDVSAVCASSRPRNTEGSYMPAFLAGSGYARVCADTINVPYFECSHQEGHIMAAIASGGYRELLDKPFISVHLSGGTTEILLSEYNGSCFSNRIIGGTRDISAGQFIDRAGVRMGLDFPCGKELEKVSASSKNPIKLPISVDGGYMNFSGVETKVIRSIDSYPQEDIAMGIFIVCARMLEKALNCTCREYGINNILFAGGVASNGVIKQYLSDNLKYNLFFSPPEFASDNACGAAALAAEKLREHNGDSIWK